MSWDQIERNWMWLKDVAAVRWPDLSEDELVQIDGKIERLVGKIEERYGIAEEHAELEVDSWRRSSLSIYGRSGRRDVWRKVGPRATGARASVSSKHSGAQVK